MRETLKRLGIVLLYIIFIFAAGEGSIRLATSFINIYNVEMLKYATKLKQRSENTAISHVHIPNSSAHLMGVDINLNSLGHRSKELKTPKPENEKRIFVLGNSITMGWGVKAGNVFTDVLESKLNKLDPREKYSVINAGVGNYNTAYELELFKMQADQVKPDMVILNFFINDAEPNPVANHNPLLKHSLFIAFTYQETMKVQAITAGKSLSQYYDEIYKSGNPSWDNCKAALQELKRLCDKRNIPIVVLFTPDIHNLNPDGPYPPLYEKAIAGVKESGLEVINTYPEFQKKYGKNPKELWVAKGDPHPNKNGHRIMAEMLYSHITNNPLKN